MTERNVVQQIRRATRRRFSSEEKIRIVLEGLRGEIPVTGAQAYRYVRTGPDHFSLAFTYDCIAWAEEVKVGKLLYI